MGLRKYTQILVFSKLDMLKFNEYLSFSTDLKHLMSQTPSQDKEWRSPPQWLTAAISAFLRPQLALWGSSDTTNHSICNEEESYGRLVSQKFLQISWPRKERPEKENQAIYGQEIILAFLRLEKETGTTVNGRLSLAHTQCQENATRMPFQRGNLTSSGQTRAPWFMLNYRVTTIYTVCVSSTMSSVLITH